MGAGLGEPSPPHTPAHVCRRRRPLRIADIETNIKAVDEKLAAGHWECENGHETDASSGNTAVDSSGQVPLCACSAPKKFISLATMTGQEKYESDREKAEAQKIATNKRAQAKAEEENAAGSEQTAKYFQDQAKNNRTIAEKIKQL